MRATYPLVVAGVLSFSTLTVYTQYVFLHTTDHVTNRPFRETSLEQYHEILAGRRPFPYQWRVAGPWLVRLGEAATGRDPHNVDAVIKILALSASALMLMRFARRRLTPLGTIAAGAMYFVLTSAAYSSEGYSIYYTNDYLMVTGWSAAICLADEARYGSVALVTFLTAWAKETVVLVPLLPALAWRRGDARARDWMVTAVAFLVPTAILRVAYPAPPRYWAWWGNVTHNVPLLSPGRTALFVALRDNVKLLVFFNVLWLLAYRGYRRAADPMVRDLVHVGLLYLAIAYVVVVIRELRHFLPLAIIILPLALMEVERVMLQGAGPRISREHSC